MSYASASAGRRPLRLHFLLVLAMLGACRSDERPDDGRDDRVAHHPGVEAVKAVKAGDTPVGGDQSRSVRNERLRTCAEHAT